MHRLRLAIRRFIETDRGATMIEYALMGGMMIIILAASIKPLGTFVVQTFEALATNGFGNGT